MKSLLSRPSAWWGRLKYPQKFVVISLLFVLPLAAFYPLVSDQITRIDQYGYKELYGTLYLRPLRHLLEDTLEHYIAAHEYHEGHDTRAELETAQSRIEADFEALQAAQRQYGSALQITTEVDDLSAQWQALKANVLELGMADIHTQHDGLIVDIRALIARVGDTSFLILDPDLDTYYMMDAVLLKLPESQTTLAQVIYFADRILHRGTLTSEERAQIIAWISLLQANDTAMTANLATALRNNASGQMSPIVTEPLQASQVATQQFIATLRTHVLSFGSTSILPEGFVAQGKNALAANFAFYDAASRALEIGGRARIDRFTSRLVFSVVVAVVGIGVAFVVGLLLMLAISRPLSQLTRATQRLATGDMSARVAVTSVDEVGQVGLAFNEMAQQLQAVRASLEARTIYLQASAEISRAVTSILDQDDLIRQVVQLITDRFGFYYAALFTLDDSGRLAMLREGTGAAGKALKESGHHLEVGGQSMVGSAVERRTARITSYVDAEAARFADPLLAYTRTEIALPLMVGDRVLGALDVHATQADAFDDASAAALQSMADQIAVALNNAELFQRVETQARVQAHLNRISRGLFSAANAEMLYRALAGQLDAIAPHDRISIALHESEGPTLRDYELRANVDPAAGEPVTRATLNTLVGRAFTTHKSAISIDTSQDVYMLADVAALARAGFRSALCVPLMLGERVLGTLNLASRKPAAFPADVIAPVEQVAAQVAVALENVRLVSAQQRSVQELEMLTRQLTAGAWAEEFKRLPEGLHHVHVARSGVQSATHGWLPEMELAVAAMKPVAWSQRKEQTISSPYQAAMAAPIVLRGEVIGALQVGEEGEPRAWSADDLTFIQSVADQVALAVENARLIDETQRAAQREKTIAEAADRIHRPIELDSILRAAVEEVQRLTGANSVGIQLGIPSGGHEGNGHESPEELRA
jgi:GAF domain-containing protein/HAMP domain-containing protein